MYEVKSWDSILVKGKVYYGILELLLKLCRKFCVCIWNSENYLDFFFYKSQKKKIFFKALDLNFENKKCFS